MIKKSAFQKLLPERTSNRLILGQGLERGVSVASWDRLPQGPHRAHIVPRGTWRCWGVHPFGSWRGFGLCCPSLCLFPLSLWFFSHLLPPFALSLVSSVCLSPRTCLTHTLSSHPTPTLPDPYSWWSSASLLCFSVPLVFSSFLALSLLSTPLLHAPSPGFSLDLFLAL